MGFLDKLSPQPELVEVPSVAGSAGDGTLSSKGPHYVVEVSQAGHSLNIDLQAFFPVAPRVIYSVLTNPDNTGVFRDIQKLGARRVVHEQPDQKVVEVEQLSSIGFGWFKKTFRTTLRVEENSETEGYLFTKSELVGSDLLREFTGVWELTPCEMDGVSGCVARLQQQATPKGTLALVERMLKQAMLVTSKRMVEDLQSIAAEVVSGVTIEEVLRARKEGATAAPSVPKPKLVTCASQLASKRNKSLLNLQSNLCKTYAH